MNYEKYIKDYSRCLKISKVLVCNPLFQQHCLVVRSANGPNMAILRPRVLQFREGPPPPLFHWATKGPNDIIPTGHGPAIAGDIGLLAIAGTAAPQFSHVVGQELTHGIDVELEAGEDTEHHLSHNTAMLGHAAT